MFLSAAAFSVLFGILLTLDATTTGGASGAPTGDATQIANSVYSAGLSVGYLLMLTIGVIQIGAEYRHKTITSTFLAVAPPRPGDARQGDRAARHRRGLRRGLAGRLGVPRGALTLQLRGEDPFPSGEIIRTLALSLLVLGLWALIGLGVGILIPNQIAALLIGVGVAWIVEPLVAFALSFWDFGRDHIAPYFPSSATNAVVNAVQNSPDEVRLSWWVAALVLAAWAAALSGFGVLRTLRQDVS